MTDDCLKDSYNKFTALPNLSYNAIQYLMDNDELIWKLLKYNDSNAYKQPDLSANEKRALIFNGVYGGSLDETEFRVFMDIGQESVWTKEVCILRISPMDLYPNNYVFGNVAMSFEVYSHYKINQLSNYQTRIMTITQKIIEVFNGSEINGLGRLYFDAKANSRCKAFAIGQIPFKGMVTIMCNYLGG